MACPTFLFRCTSRGKARRLKGFGAPEVRFHWPTHEWVKGSYACYTPGQRTAFRGAEGERVGQLHFAGEHCSLQFQGFMEGAIETGEATARALLADLAIRSPPLRRSA